MNQTQSDDSPSPINLDTISKLFYYSMHISAIKKYSNFEYSLRVNPSSGNLHPLEAYLIYGDKDHKMKLYHYCADSHKLEVRGEYSNDLDDQNKGFYVVISSIAWRESWKYGERGFRYCQLDTGHVLACLKFSSKLLNLKCELVVSVEQIGKISGTN